jgi:GNAT superfamily N-acetyltransferase
MSTEDPTVTPIPVGPWFEWHRDGYVVSTDPRRPDIPALTRILAATYWAAEIDEDVVRRSVEHSVDLGLYEAGSGTLVGFARVVTDRATFAWVGDVWIDPAHRGRGLARWLMRCMLAHPELQGLRRWLLATSDAHGLYAQVGFTPMAAPDRFMEIVDMDVHRRQAAARAADAARVPG